MNTHGIYGPLPWILVGPFTWIVAVGTYEDRWSFTAVMYMGMGIGTIGFNWAYRFDIGVDTMGGISLQLYFLKKGNYLYE